MSSRVQLRYIQQKKGEASIDRNQTSVVSRFTDAQLRLFPPPHLRVRSSLSVSSWLSETFILPDTITVIYAMNQFKLNAENVVSADVLLPCEACLH